MNHIPDPAIIHIAAGIFTPAVGVANIKFALSKYPCGIVLDEKMDMLAGKPKPDQKQNNKDQNNHERL